MAKIFLTGITGFLGSNVANALIGHGHTIFAIYRSGSSRELCRQNFDKIQWILQTENDQWIEKVVDAKPDAVIHSAWTGVGYDTHDDWQHQFRNVELLNKVLLVTKDSGARKFIGFGSQAEYGRCEGLIPESHPLAPNDVYGVVKTICSEIVKRFCDHNAIDWYWLRLFSFYGEGGQQSWLIPSLINGMISADHMDLTPGEQKYSYLYAGDLGVAVNKIILKKTRSGIYNIAGSNLITLKHLVESIRNLLNPAFKLNFGKLPYRPDQSMHKQGDSSKFIREFGEFELSDFNKSILKTVAYFKKNLPVGNG